MKESTLNELPPAPSGPPLGGVPPAAPSPVGAPPVSEKSGRAPSKVVLLSDRVAAAAETLSMPLTVSSAAASKAVVPRSTESLDWLTVVVPSVVAPSSAPKSKFAGPPAPASPSAGAVGVWLTVMSVPTP